MAMDGLTTTWTMQFKSMFVDLLVWGGSEEDEKVDGYLSLLQDRVQAGKKPTHGYFMIFTSCLVRRPRINQY